jgi:tetratricopeptide (TPR) repeat protein/predicted Ser/Thr protein kinase
MDDFVSARPTVTLPDADKPIDETTPGARIGRYVVIGRLGAGGMGRVYGAYDTQLERRVAIKVLQPSARGTGGHARLLREAQAMARLAHPNVVTVYDVGAYGADVFIAMEYVEGRTLKAWMAEPHPWREALAVLAAAGRGLAAAHAAGIIHRDFKPENVLLGKDGRVLVADFGIARGHRSEPSTGEPAPMSAPASGAESAESADPSTEARTGPALSTETTRPSSLDAPLTQTGELLGTPGYMAPEQALDSRDDARSDQFSFAVTLYRVLYGQSPFVFSNIYTYLTALDSPPRPPPANTRVPAWVHAVIARGLERDPANRFASMADMLAALDRDPTRRRRVWALAAGALALAATGVFGWGHQRRVVREECAAGDRLIVETWNPSVRDAVGAAIRATNVPVADDVATRTQRILDDWATAWSGAYREASEATLLRGVESAATMKIRIACLERERGDMGTLVDRFAHANKAVANRAINAAMQLPRAQMCWEPNAAHAAALPEAQAPRARVLALQRQIAEASAMSTIGDCDGALQVATRGIEEARAIPHRESEAELLQVRAKCQRQKGDFEADVATQEEAFAAAIAAGDDSLAAVVAAQLSVELANRLAKFREAERWLAIGRGVREREGQDDRAEAHLLTSELGILSQEGYPERAIPLHERAIAAFGKVYGPNSIRVAVALSNYSNDLDSVGRKEESLTVRRRSIQMQEEIFGPRYPMMYVDYVNLGSDTLTLGRYDEARQALEHAFSVLKPLGEMNANAIHVWAAMAVLDNRTGHPDSALTDVERAMAIIDATGDSGAMDLPSLLVERGMALLAKGQAAGARDACTRSLKLQEAQGLVDPDKLYAADALTCLGEAYLALGKIDDALARLERGATLKKRDFAAEFPLAEFALAKALRAAGRDPKRARSLAETALAGLKDAPGADAQRQTVEAWLAAVEGR